MKNQFDEVRKEMPNNYSNPKRVAKNTLMLYFRQFLIMIVSLYTVRVVLNVLGTEDYGIYNVVAGFVTMFNFLSTAMATASQRYFSYDLGIGDEQHLNVSFCVTFLIYLLLCLIILIVAETIGIWFVINKLVIPAERRTASIIIYQFSIISFISTLITTPYKADIIAHECMDAYAYISIVEVFLKLAVVFVLKKISFDKLIIYGLLQCLVIFISAFLYRLYAKKKFPECHFRFIIDKNLLKEMISYSSWNLFGSSVSVVKNQALNVLLNLFFGPVVNAARGIAFQVNSAVVSFAHNFSTALRPQIIKTYSMGNEEESLNYVYAGSKLTFFLMYIFSLPLTFEMNFVLNLWLKSNVPQYAIIFTQLVLFDALIDCMGYPVMTLAHATGKIKLYQGLVGGIVLLNLPISYVFLRIGIKPYEVMVISILITIISSIVRLFIVQRISCFSVWKYFKKVVFPCMIIGIITISLVFFVTKIFGNGWQKFILTVLFSTCIVIISFLILGLTKSEKKIFKDIIIKKFMGKRE